MVMAAELALHSIKFIEISSGRPQMAEFDKIDSLVKTRFEEVPAIQHI